MVKSESGQQQEQPFLSCTEGRFFVVGVALLLFFLVYLGSIYLQDVSLANRILSMVAAEILGGRSTGLPLGLQQGVPVPLAILFSVLQDLIILYLFAPLVTIFSDRLPPDSFLGWLIKRSRNQVDREHSAFVRRFRYVAVVLMVWIPFYMTGTLVGFITALLLGIAVHWAILLATLATLVGAISWAFAFRHFLLFLEGIGKGLPLIVVLSVVALVLVVHARNLRLYLKEKKENKLL